MTLYEKNADASLLEPYYYRHIQAMTAEELCEKSDIAAELARRDKRIHEQELYIAETIKPLIKMVERLDELEEISSNQNKKIDEFAKIKDVLGRRAWDALIRESEA